MKEYPYRKGANAFVVDNDNNFLLVQKNGYDENQWDAPGGGLDDDEDPKEGILRELEEELGTNKFEIIEQSDIIKRFEWPQDAQDWAYTKHGKRWRGQEKYQFIIRFTGEKNEIKIQEEEIRKVKWVPHSELKNHLVFEGQWENAQKVLSIFITNQTV